MFINLLLCNKARDNFDYAYLSIMMAADTWFFFWFGVENEKENLYSFILSLVCTWIENWNINQSSQPSCETATASASSVWLYT